MSAKGIVLATSLAMGIATAIVVGGRLEHAESPASRVEATTRGPQQAGETRMVATFRSFRTRDSAAHELRTAGNSEVETFALFPGLLISGNASPSPHVEGLAGVVSTELDSADVSANLTKEPEGALRALRHNHRDRERAYVFVVDSGVDETAPGMGGAVMSGWSSSKESSTSDCAGHGTAVAHVIRHVAGRAGDLRIVPVRVVSCNGRSSLVGLLRGLEWIGSHGAPAQSVINISLSFPLSRSLNLSVQGLADRGFRVVVAAGNDEADACGFSPSAAPSARSVGVGTGSRPVANSNGGPCVDTWIDPRDVETQAIASDGTARTSLAAAIVSGRVAARLFQAVLPSPAPVRS